MYETEVTVVGTLITAVDRRRLFDGGVVSSFRVVSNSRRFDRASESWTDGDSLFVSVTCWRQLAENVHASFAVGDPIIVRGRLRTRTYDGKEGRRHSVTELDAVAVGPDLARSTARITRTRRSGAAADASLTRRDGPQEAPSGSGTTEDWPQSGPEPDDGSSRPAEGPERGAEAGPERRAEAGPERRAEAAVQRSGAVEAGVGV